MARRDIPNAPPSSPPIPLQDTSCLCRRLTMAENRGQAIVNCQFLLGYSAHVHIITVSAGEQPPRFRCIALHQQQQQQQQARYDVQQGVQFTRRGPGGMPLPLPLPLPLAPAAEPSNKMMMASAVCRSPLEAMEGLLRESAVQAWRHLCGSQVRQAPTNTRDDVIGGANREAARGGEAPTSTMSPQHNVDNVGSSSSNSSSTTTRYRGGRMGVVSGQPGDLDVGADMGGDEHVHEHKRKGADVSTAVDSSGDELCSDSETYDDYHTDTEVFDDADDHDDHRVPPTTPTTTTTTQVKATPQSTTPPTERGRRKAVKQGESFVTSPPIPNTTEKGRLASSSSSSAAAAGRYARSGGQGHDQDKTKENNDGDSLDRLEKAVTERVLRGLLDGLRKSDISGH